MEFLAQLIEIMILSKADEASVKGNRKQTALWLMAFVILIALAIGIFWMKDSLIDK